MSDGVSIVSRNWQLSLQDLGFQVVTVAGEGKADRLLPGLAIAAPEPPKSAELHAALADVDLVVVENLCTIPLNIGAARLTADCLRGRPTIMHHHDPPWQRDNFIHITEMPYKDDTWCHVTINHLTSQQMRQRGIEARCIYNGFPTATGGGDRQGVRQWLNVTDDVLLIGHPVRAIARKNIAQAISLCEDLGGVYWLWGDAEDNYRDELKRLLTEARCPIVQGTPQAKVVDLYQASDAIVFPSTWEGFGNPPIEASIHRRLVAVGDYPVATELQELGFVWFPSDDAAPLAQALACADEVLEHNRAIAVKHFSLETMTTQIAALLEDFGWLP